MRRHFLTILALGVMLVLCLPIAAYGAQYGGGGPGEPNYVAVKAGIFIPAGDLEDLDFDTGFNGQVVLGHHYHQNFALEIGVGFFESGSDTPDGDFWAIPVDVTVKAVLPVEQGNVYAGAGVGIYFASFEQGAVDDDDTVFGGHAIVGGEFGVGSDVYLGVEGKFILTDEADFGPVSVDLNGFMITGNIGYRF